MAADLAGFAVPQLQGWIPSSTHLNLVLAIAVTSAYSNECKWRGEMFRVIWLSIRVAFMLAVVMFAAALLRDVFTELKSRGVMRG
jgi:hypothetical protein